MKTNKSIIDVSWKLFLKTGDPFYMLAKNTFERLQRTQKSSQTNNENKKEEDGLINS